MRITCAIITRKNIHNGYTVAYETAGLSPGIVSFAAHHSGYRSEIELGNAQSN